MDVGREIRRAREAKGWSQAKLAGASDMGVSGISQIETGARNPSVVTLSKIAEALGVGVADLFPKGQVPLPLEEPPALEASDEDFEEMAAEADEDQLAAMKRQLQEHLPPGGPLPLPRPTRKQLLAMHRCVAVYREQKKRIEAAEEHLEARLEAITA